MKIKNFSSLFGGIILFLSLFLCLYNVVGYKLCNGDTSKLTYFGYKLVYVASESMEPEIMTGAYGITKNIKPEDVKIGDIITYATKTANGSYKTIIHRVIGITPNGYFIFKGDNNKMSDEPVAPSQIRQKLIYFKNPTV